MITETLTGDNQTDTAANIAEVERLTAAARDDSLSGRYFGDKVSREGQALFALAGMAANEAWWAWDTAAWLTSEGRPEDADMWAEAGSLCDAAKR